MRSISQEAYYSWRAAGAALLRAARSDGSVYVIAIFMIAGLVGAWVKLVEMELASGYLTISRFIGRSTASDLTLIEQLSFFRYDLIVQLVLLPLFMLLLVRPMAPRRRLVTSACIATLLCIAYYFQLQSLGSVGRYLSWHMATDALVWAGDNPDAISDYLSLGGAVKLIAASAAMVLLIWIASKRDAPSILGRIGRCTEVATLAVLPAALLLSVATFAAGMPEFPQHRSVPVSIVLALIQDGSDDLLPPETPRSSLVELYRRTARLSQAAPSGFSTGRDTGHDVILFIMETGPRLTWDRTTLPGVRQLLPQSFVSDRHYTTHPYTSDAIFSIVSGMYPLGRRDYLAHGRPMRESGLLGPLQSLGYVGMAYLPWPDTFEADATMYAKAGLSQIYTADLADRERQPRALQRARLTIDSLPADSPAVAGRRASLEERLVRDLMALDKMKEDIIAQKTANRRFVAAFMPQIGHAPWFDLYGHDAVVDRGRALTALQDGWLLEIAGFLRERGWLENTVIVLTGDHGVRTRVDDPAFESGVLTEYTFNVPLLIFAPGTLTETRTLGERTSHIDIAPTIHGLLGVNGDPDTLAQGVPVWASETLASRRLFFFAGDYLGADGYGEPGRFVMHQRPTNATSVSTHFAFSHDTIVPLGRNVAGLIAPIKTMYSLQQRMLGALQ